MVIGPNQKRCRGRNGLSVGATNARAVGSVESGPLIDTPVPVAAGEIGPIAARRIAGRLDVAERIPPHAEHEVDVFLPESLVLVGDVVFALDQV